MLALGVGAQAATTVFVSVPPFLIPLLHTGYGYSLAQAGLLASAPNLGLVLTLVAWGALADRYGERVVIAIGVGATAVSAVAAMLAGGDLIALAVLLFFGGMASASVNAASGRVVIGWFPRHRRGLAMGIRQMAQPLGVAVAALVVPPIAAAAGIPAALAVPAVLLAVLAVACAIGIVDPPRAARDAAAPARNPYRGSGALWRIHGVSALLVVPQFTLSTFGLVWLIVDQSWDPAAAGVLIAVAQFAGAFGRIAVGVLSDRVGSRLAPLRWVAVAGVIALLLLAGTSALHAGVAVAAVLFVVATTISVADNGLAFTSVAEIAGPSWSGRALGAQNTGQFAAAAVAAPAIGALIGLVGYPLAFVVVALAPVVALPLVPSPRREEALQNVG
ncbi:MULTISPECIES: MFS transporter [unclassified Rathayibacter]|uniref:MFS transporter n=1 Tax=unclassified Rathayibacter TaxID=2609250 RepID=UPI0006F7539A|nr:MFS transporter [Rathayibacter sp. Leaf185]KQQ04260.1 MFS transporter [Rathayibacter sp. Leaf294]KQS12714.1 MFS transporter [Rathayibacter sp. Leaf185]